MSLERRIADALHAADDYEPSQDLFSRLHRSIEEDSAHRHRVRKTIGLVSVGVVVLSGFLVTVAQRSSDGTVTVPRWSVQMAVALILTTVLVSLGPVLRRLGSPLLEEVFHLNAATGQRFSRLLDIAYYLFFGGLIVNGVDLHGLADQVGVSSDEVWTALARIASFLLQLGVVHTANLALLPLIGLLFNSSVRRARRRAAGTDAPAESPDAHKADRFAGIIVMTVAALAIAGALVLVGVVLVSLGLS
jgi:hypothetical protein